MRRWKKKKDLRESRRSLCKSWIITEKKKTKKKQTQKKRNLGPRKSKDTVGKKKLRTVMNCSGLGGGGHEERVGRA